MRARLIQPEFWSSRTLMRVSCRARLTFIGLWTCSDDYGTILNSPRKLLGEIYPFDSEVTDELFAGWLAELVREYLVVPVAYNGQQFLIIRNWFEHQHVVNPSRRRWLPDDETIYRLLSDYLVAHNAVDRGYALNLNRNLNRNQNKNAPPPPEGGVTVASETVSGEPAEPKAKTKKAKPPEITWDGENFLVPTYWQERFNAIYGSWWPLEVKKAAMWHVEAERKGKGKSQYGRFIQNWLSRALEEREKKGMDTTPAKAPTPESNGRPHTAEEFRKLLDFAASPNAIWTNSYRQCIMNHLQHEHAWKDRFRPIIVAATDIDTLCAQLEASDAQAPA